MTVSRFSTGLREHARETIEKIGRADIVVGVPCYQSAASLAHVILTIAKGIETHYPDAKALIMISDGGSTDDSREVARRTEVTSFNIEKLVTIYRGIPGKGSGLRAVFEVAKFLKVQAVAVFDSDLKSINPAWIKKMLQPVFEGYDFVAPYYQRYKFDGTITNTIAHNLTRALYGAKIRQPIGGDFGISLHLVRHFLEQEVWETDVAKFGIDIYMTTSAIVHGFKICQARLGPKVHGQKDPSADLGPMFRQVVGTIFALMETFEEFWKDVKASHKIPILGEEVQEEPAPFEIDRDGLVEYFRLGFGNFEGIWQRILEERDFDVYKTLVKSDRPDEFRLPIDTWVRTVYRYAAAYQVTPRQRMKVVDTMVPLYNARVASLIYELRDKNPEESEKHFDENAQAFENMKEYLQIIWKKGA
jgi:glycosyltransferase involved in cell wall biosynthesis